MKKGFTYIGMIVCLVAACQQSPKAPTDQKETLLDEIAQFEKVLLQEGDATKEKETAMAMVEKCEQYASAFPNDSATPNLLFKAADVARGAKDYGKAVQLWGQLWRTYPGHPQAPMALFLQGFTFDSDLQDVKMASKYYTEFLGKYPEDSLAAQVKQLLQVVETSPSDLIKQFEKNSKQD